MRQILYNGLRTPDGTIISSSHRHDYQTYRDKNGKEYMIDGGLDYIRCSSNGDEVFLTVYSDDSIILKRKFVRRWNLFTGKYVILEDMSNDWLDNLIEMLVTPVKVAIITDAMILTFIQEKQYRIENEIFIPEDEEISAKAQKLKEKIQNRLG
jgi:hypothetical protein